MEGESKLRPDAPQDAAAEGAAAGAPESPAAPPTPPPPPEPPAYVAPQAGAPDLRAPLRAQGLGPGGTRMLVLGMVAVFLLAALGGGAVFANASLSSQYSPQRVVTDYFAAMAKGNVAGMMANANFVKGNGAYDEFFDESAVMAMMALPENKAISDVRITATHQLDDSTIVVSVSMAWNAVPVTFDYRVRKDTSRAHYVFYNSWLVDIPSSSISITLPNQAGAISIDGIALPVGSSGSSVQVVQGYHAVTMAATDLYDSATFSADAVANSAVVTIPSKLSAAAISGAADAVKRALIACDPSQYVDCPGHTYSPPSGYYWTVPFPVYGKIDVYKSYEFTFTRDPTAGMQVQVGRDTGKLTASGDCALTLTIDGSKVYKYAGTWDASLVVSHGVFDWDSYDWHCDDVAA